MDKYYSDQRQDYRQVILTEADSHPDPVQQFERWLDEAIEQALDLPNAMVLATVTAQGRPAARYVLLKELRPDGFVFYTHTSSDKGRQLAQQAYAALVFYWQPLHRQVRIEGEVSMVSDEEADAYFLTRPYGSRLSVWVAPQSSVVADRAFLEDRMQTLQQTYPDEHQVPRPATWTGYRVTPERMEFWQGRQSRLHDRLLYRKTGSDWRMQRLAP